MSKTYSDEVLESQLAHSPSELEMQHMVEYRPYTAINGDKWIKCDKCFNSYHVDCLKEYMPKGVGNKGKGRAKQQCREDDDDDDDSRCASEGGK